MHDATMSDEHGTGVSQQGLDREVARLRSPATIRERSHALYTLACAGGLDHFNVDRRHLPAVAERVVEVTRASYPTLDIPVHGRFRHFDAGGVPRLAALKAKLARLDGKARARALVDLTVVSVLLDAGAGAAWKYRDGDTTLARSEGLAVASLRMFEEGIFSSHEALEVDAEGLVNVPRDALAVGLQATAENPVVGLDGRLHVLHGLGAALLERGMRRPGDLVDELASRAIDGEIRAEQVLGALLGHFSSMWPSRLALGGHPLGDVWTHAKLGNGLASYVPFHKLSQWLTYSLVEPLSEAGLDTLALDALTGLPEYRNGGLFLDLGVLVPKHDGVLGEAHDVSSEVVVEWRALTVALIDELAPRVREHLGFAAERFPLARMLEGGTWAAGRAVAAERRPGGGSPLTVISDGTVF